MILLPLAQSLRSRNANKKRSEAAWKSIRPAANVKEPTKTATATKTPTATRIESTIFARYGFSSKRTVKKVAPSDPKLHLCGERRTSGGNVVPLKPILKVKSKPAVRKKKIHPVPKDSENEDIVKKFIECINTQDVDGCIALLKDPQHWRFSGETNITIKHYGEMIQKIIRSFPDFSIKCSDVVEVGNGVVQVRQAVESGTHTGEPFGFQCYQMLPATGLKCINDPEHLTFFINDGKIVQVHVLCTGAFCGPVGLYKQSKTAVDLPKHSFDPCKHNRSVATASSATYASSFAILRKSLSSRRLAAIAA